MHLEQVLPAKLLGVVMAVACLIGCGTLDVASRHTGPPAKCEVHGKVMASELIKMSSGEIIYQTHYLESVRTGFPHHGDWLFQGERAYGRISGQVRDFVCSDCTASFRRYWARESK